MHMPLEKLQYNFFLSFLLYGLTNKVHPELSSCNTIITYNKLAIHLIHLKQHHLFTC